MIGWPSRHLRHHTVEAKLAEIKRIDKSLNHANRIVLVDIIIKRGGQQRTLRTSLALNKSFHRQSPISN